ncbi:MAG: FtsW/RodA/SpoVE family cell cycle protein [Dorea sp.]|nr:FtsW/RodA/SpoVE family cell cycle protein [Dorea sp.]
MAETKKKNRRGKASKKPAPRKTSTKTRNRRKKELDVVKVNGNNELRAMPSSESYDTGVHLGDSYYNLIFGTIIMICIGLLTIYIATGDLGMIIKQGLIAVGSIFLMLIFISRLGTILYKKFVWAEYIVGIALILALTTGMAISVNGASRWLSIGGISLQVVEIVKVVVIIVCAYLLDKNLNKMNPTVLTFYVWIVAAIPALLIITISSDLSSGLVIILIAGIMTFVVMKNWLLHVGVGLVGIAGFYVVYMKKAIDYYNLYGVADLKAMHADGTLPYRVERILGWLYPASFQEDFAFQTSQSVHAIGSAGFLGKGLGSTLGTENFFAIESDFIIAQVASSFGILGLLCILALFLFIVYNIIYTASCCRNNLFDCLLCTGVATHFLCQNLINFSVATGVFPNTGIPFIFLSNGNTGLLINCIEIGIILAINKKAGKLQRKKGII